MSESKSEEILLLRMMKRVLTDIAKETYVRPGLKPPLSENTILNIRDCLALITTRERELDEKSGRRNRARPRFADKSRTSQVVQLHSKENKNHDKTDNHQDD